MAQTPQVATGARAIFQITTESGGTKRVAFATSVNYRISIPHSPIAVLGRYSVAGHEPVGLDVSFSCGTVRVPGKSAVQLGIQPALQALMTSEELQVTITDRKLPETTILKLEGVRLVDRAGGMGARDIVSETWDFVGRIMSDEGTPDGQAETENHSNPYGTA